MNLLSIASAVDARGLLGDAYQQVASSLNALAANDSAVAQRLESMGLGDTQNGKFSVNESKMAERFASESNLTPGTGKQFMDGVRRLTNSLSDEDGANYKQSQSDTKIAASMWNGVANLLSSNGVEPTITEPVRAFADIFTKMGELKLRCKTMLTGKRK